MDKLTVIDFFRGAGGFSELQEMYGKQQFTGIYSEPTLLIEEIARLIEIFQVGDKTSSQSPLVIFREKKIPDKQLFALYAINRISSTTNKKQHGSANQS